MKPLMSQPPGAGTAVIEDAYPSPELSEVFFRREWPVLVRLGRLLTGSQHAGEDLAQDAIANLLRQPGRIEAPHAYLRRTMVNLNINGARRTARERAHLRSVRPEQPVPPPEPDGLWPLIVAMPARQRAVVVLRYYEDLSEAEIARILECRPGTVKSLDHRALNHLRQELRS